MSLTSLAVSPRAAPLMRALALGALLVLEILLLSLRFDSQSLVGLSDAWAVVVRQVPWLTRLGGVAALTALLLVVLCRRGEPLPIDAPPAGHGMLCLAAHLVCLGLFAVVTAQLLEGPIRHDGRPELWTLLWMALGMGVLVFWAASVIAPSQWCALVVRTWPALAAGVVVGAVVRGIASFTDELWHGLGAATLSVSAALLRLLPVDIVYRPDEAVLGTSTFQVEIASACSGYEGLALILAFLSVYLWLFRRELRFPHALLLLPLGLVVIWLANALRIALLIAVGTWISPTLALGGFHSQAGWLAFLAVALGLVVVSRRSRVFQRDTEAPSSATEPINPIAAYLMPLLMLLFVQMFTAALTDGFDYLLPLRVFAVGGTLLYYRHGYDLGEPGASATGERRASFLRSLPLPARRPLSISGSAVAVLFGVAVFALWVLLEPLYPSTGAERLPAHLAELPRGAAFAWLVLRVLQSVVLVPLAEELAFRGYLLRRLIAADFQAVAPRRFTLLSFGVSSLLFGVLHGRWLAGTLCGMIFALAVYRRGRLGDAVVAHAVANALIAACVLFGGAWYFWN